MKSWVLAAGVVALSVAVGVGAQQPAPASGTVTGHVTCGDTQRPARFASVLLFGVPASVTAPAPAVTDQKDNEQVMAAMKAGMAVLNNTSYVMTQTDQEGAFTATGVSPGDYYVFASVPGYVQPINTVKAAVEAGADPHKPLPGVPMVHVSAARESMADISIERGAAISGKVMWEDGSPVTKATVQVVAAKGEKPLPPQYSMIVVSSIGAGGVAAITDDLGRFRIAGLAPGDYFVKVNLQTSSELSMQKGKMNFNISKLAAVKPLTIFAPASFHQANGKAVTLRAGQSVDDEEVTINLTNLHSVSGRIASAEDHHAINSGTVTLTDATDKDFARSASVNDDGSFIVTFVPAGTYNLKVEDAADTVPSTKKPKGLLNFDSDDAVRSYDDAKSQVIVADDDVTGQNVELAPSKTVKKPLDMQGIVGTMMGGSPPAASSGEKQ